MAITPLRRIEAPARPGLYVEIMKEALSEGVSRRDLSLTEREHPELILRREGSILAAARAGTSSLAYAFRSERDFVELFAGMFEELVPKVRRTLHSDTIRFRLTHSP